MEDDVILRQEAGKRAVGAALEVARLHRQPEPTGRTALQLLDVRRRAHAAVDEKGRRPIGKEPQKQRQGELKGDEDVRAEQRLLKARRCGLLLRVVARELYERLKVDRRAARLCRKRRTEFGTLAAKD